MDAANHQLRKTLNDWGWGGSPATQVLVIRAWGPGCEPHHPGRKPSVCFYPCAGEKTGRA